jgi:predicted SAM-dependent methyltransferase
MARAEPRAALRRRVTPAAPGITIRPPAMPTDARPTHTYLRVGCGLKRKDRTTPGFDTPDWAQTRLEIDPAVAPDVIGSMTDMQAVPAASVGAVFSSHNIEHLLPHEVPLALREFLRVLRDDGYVVITCPDLRSICRLVAEDKLMETVVNAPAGPISPLDMLYGHRPSLAAGNLFMAHRCGFTSKVLAASLQAAGFRSVAIRARGRAPLYDLWALASKSRRDDAQLRELVALHFPQ